MLLWSSSLYSSVYFMGEERGHRDRSSSARQPGSGAVWVQGVGSSVWNSSSALHLTLACLPLVALCFLMLVIFSSSVSYAVSYVYTHTRTHTNMYLVGFMSSLSLYPNNTWCFLHRNTVILTEKRRCSLAVWWLLVITELQVQGECVPAGEDSSGIRLWGNE